MSDSDNTAPVSFGRNISVILNTPKIIELQATDRDGDVLVYRIIEDPSHGTLKKITGTKWRFSPETGFSGTDRFTFTANDGYTDGNTSAINLTIGVANNPPVAHDIAVFAPLGKTTEITLNASDSDEDDYSLLTYSIINNSGPVSGTTPSYGTLVQSTDDPKVWIYTPYVSTGATDYFKYKANDGYDDSNIATVLISVGYENSPPEASDGNFETDEDTPYTGDIPVTDADISNGDSIHVEITSRPAHGSIDISGTSFTYTPEADYSGEDAFTYRAADLTGIAENTYTGTCTISITVNPVNDGPSASSFITTVLKGSSGNIIQLNKSDIDTDVLTYSMISEEETLGSAEIPDQNSPECIYTPPDADFTGTDEFSYNVSDGFLISDNAVVTVIVKEAGIIFVDSGAPSGGNNGSCWDLAYKTLQEAIDSAVTGDSIWVAEGTYSGGGEGTGSIATFNSGSALSVYGGFTGDENGSVDEINNRDTANNISVLDGNSAYHVIISNGDVQMDGFTITGGKATGTGEDSSGGGIYVKSGSISLNNIEFTDNTAAYGGALFAGENSTSTITDCDFDENSASQKGGAIFSAEGSSVVNISSSEFISNNATVGGGALFISSLSYDESYPFTASGLTLSANSSSEGGAVSVSGKAYFSACLFSGNASGLRGGAVYNSSGMDVLFEACAFETNTAGGDGGALFNTGLCTIKGYTDILGIASKTTFTGNISQGNGGAVFNGHGGSNSQGISVAECEFSGNSAAGSGGAVCNSRVSPEFTGAVFNDNSATSGGAITNIEGAGTEFSGCEISSNEATEGGGIYNNYSSPVFTDCKISSNQATYGGGIYNCNNSAPVFFGAVVSGNSAGRYTIVRAAGYGAAVYDHTSSPEYINSLITRNNITILKYEITNEDGSIDSEYYGSGILYSFSSDTKLINCTICRNKFFNVYAGTGTESTSFSILSYLVRSTNSSFDIYNSIIYNNDHYDGHVTTFRMFSNPDNLNAGYNCIEGEDEDIFDNTNITNNPRLIDIDNNDFRLDPDDPEIPETSEDPLAELDIISPCINAGIDSIAPDYISKYFFGLIQSRTTDGANADTGIIDMGYHYEL